MLDIREYADAYAVEIAELFHQSVHAIDASVYTPEEKEAWAPTPPDYSFWAERLKVKQPFVAMLDGSVVGFMELDADGHIDCAYTHPHFQRKGVASALYRRVLEVAQASALTRLYVEASWVAKPFFAYHGFQEVQKNEIERRGVTLINFTMEKILCP